MLASDSSAVLEDCSEEARGGEDGRTALYLTRFTAFVDTPVHLMP